MLSSNRSSFVMVFSALVTLVVILFSCNKSLIRGEGSVGTRVLNLNNFNAVESHYDIKAVITYGPMFVVNANGYNNLLDILDCKVENGILKLKYNTRYNTIRNGNIVVHISMPELNGVSIHGSKNVDVQHFLNGNTIAANIHGSGDIVIDNCKYQAAVLNIHGSGSIKGEGLQVKQSEVNIHGSGHASLFVTEQLKANIFGSGNIYYWGNPTVQTSLNGTGRAIKR